MIKISCVNCIQNMKTSKESLVVITLSKFEQSAILIAYKE